MEQNYSSRAVYAHGPRVGHLWCRLIEKVTDKEVNARLWVLGKLSVQWHAMGAHCKREGELRMATAKTIVSNL